MRFNTGLLHAGRQGSYDKGATQVPVYQSSAFAQESAERLEKIFAGTAPGFCYTRVANPTVTAFEERMTWLESGRASIAAASGMAAIFNGVCGMLTAGDEIIATTGLYGGTMDLFRDLEAFDIHVNYVDNIDAATLEQAVSEHTKLIFAETIGNPKLNVLDIRKAAEAAHAHGLPLMIDNTAATAYLIRPIALGADFVINSTSKYVNGSSNSISGVLTDAGTFRFDPEKYPALAPYRKYGPMAYTAKLRETLYRNTGASLAPMNAYLNLLGMETLGLRMERICQTAYRLAEWFAQCKEVATVNYPGLSDSPWHATAKEQFEQKGYGGLLTIRLGTKQRAYETANRLQYATEVSNIGDARTLVLHPDSTIFAHNTPEEKIAAGVYEDQLRISVGLEDAEDLIEDFARALQADETKKS